MHSAGDVVQAFGRAYKGYGKVPGLLMSDDSKREMMFAKVWNEVVTSMRAEVSTKLS